jgi:hypothetical protein
VFRADAIATRDVVGVTVVVVGSRPQLGVALILAAADDVEEGRPSETYTGTPETELGASFADGV